MNETQEGIIELCKKDGGCAFLSSTYFVEKLPVTYDTVMKNLKELVDEGILELKREGDYKHPILERNIWVNWYRLKETSPKCVRQLSLLELRFNGSDYKPEVDNPRLSSQLNRIVMVMQDGRWRTLSEIENLTGDPQASISAQLRHLRKPRFGSHTVNKRPRGDRARGLFEYQVVMKEEEHESSA